MKVQNHYNRVMNSINCGNDKVRKAVKTLSSGNPNAPSGKVSQKQNHAQEKAMGIIKRAFAGERKIDENVTRHKMRIVSLEGDIRRNLEEIKLIQQKQDDLQELYGIGNDDKEQKDLRLLLKQNLSEEEAKYVSKLYENGLSDYQQRCLKIESEKAIYRTLNESILAEISEENDNIHTIMEERKKHNPMKDATEAAEEVLVVANQEAKEIALQEIVGKIEKESREFKEKLVEKLAEEQKDRANSSRDANESKSTSKEQSDYFAEISNDTASQSNSHDQINKDIKHILVEMNMVEEDVKGAVVDKSC
ncbi:MAG: hypothetical protein FWC09_00855 [Lachnospiraceae bacterium]|nr:hypothetical protein [Lachnospiraceae bacterium]